jgi:hypothetical protein
MVPSSSLAYLRGQWRGVGHNPLGALSVFALLGLLAFQVASGLFANDDIAFRGPLHNLIGKRLERPPDRPAQAVGQCADRPRRLHLAAIAFYIRIKKDNLVRPMLTGWKEVEPGQGTSATGGGPLAFIVALLALLWLRSMPHSGAWLPTATRRHRSRRQPGRHQRLEAACGQARFWRPFAQIAINPCGTCRGRPCSFRRSCQTAP